MACTTSGDQLSASNVPAPSLEKLADGVWIHKSYELVPPWGPVLSQGLVVVKNGQAIIIDSAWNDTDTAMVLDLIRKDLGALPVLAIPTHAHSDKMGGLGQFKKEGVDTVAHPFTNEDAETHGVVPAARSFPSPFRFAKVQLHDSKDYTVLAEGPLVEVFYPGEGHTRDNIVVYVPSVKVVFVGCLVRPGEASSMGNTADSNLAAWATSISAVAERFPDADIVVPSHGKPGGRELLDHTIDLAHKANKERNDE